MNAFLWLKTRLFRYCLLLAVASGGMAAPGAVAAQANPVTTLAAEETFSLAVMADGTVRSWGYNDCGQLGAGDINITGSYSPVRVYGLTGVKAVAAGRSFGLALKKDGTVWSWGFNGWGQLGNGTDTDSAVPVRVSSLSGVIAIAAGSTHGMALKGDGKVWVWGDNMYGQLGDDDGASAVPIQIANLTGVVAISAGFAHNLALKEDGTVWSWGWNLNGQLGHSYRKPAKFKFNISAPLGRVIGLEGATAISAGGGHSLALKRDGTVWGWGSNDVGQLGNVNSERSLSPVQAPGIGGIAAIAAGSGYSLVLKRDGDLLVWSGNDETDELFARRPLPVGGLSSVTAMAAGVHALILKTDGTVWGWGGNQYGQLGDAEVYILKPARISGL